MESMPWNSSGCARKIGKNGLSSGSEANDAACPAYTASSLLTPNESMCQIRRKTAGMATTSAGNHRVVDNGVLVNPAARGSTASDSVVGRESTRTSDAIAGLPPIRGAAHAECVSGTEHLSRPDDEYTHLTATFGVPG